MNPSIDIVMFSFSLFMALRLPGTPKVIDRLDFMPAMHTNLLHVTNGESAGNTLRQTTVGGAVLAWQDVLHEGPVPAVPRAELLQERARFLAASGWGSEAAVLSSLERRDRLLLDALRDGAHVVLWFEHDLYDQLQLIDALTLAHSVGVAPELIVIGSFPGRPSFAGLGELSATELEALWPSRNRATPEALEAAVAAWAAVCEPEPTSLAKLAARDNPHLPLLAPALRRLLAELPSPADGLSLTERFALASIAAGARSAPAAFVASQRREDAPFLGDTWFYRTLSALGQGEHRLVEGDRAPLPPPPPLSDGESFARLELHVTETGERVLRGEANRVELLGIDRWVGGTHVTHG
jgi:hypothetical protein